LLEDAADRIDEASDIDGHAKKIYHVIQRWCSELFFIFIMTTLPMIPPHTMRRVRIKYKEKRTINGIRKTR